MCTWPGLKAKALLVHSSSQLRRHGLKTGLFTSPHLIDVTERFRINGVPVKREVLYEAFYFVWDTLHETLDDAEDFPPVPGFFRFLTLVGFKIFATLKTDVVVLEVGMGGRLDATNICNPVVCGITPLDLDHTRVLGDTIDKIAYEKSGIMKIENVPCFTGVNHDPEAMKVIQNKAKEINCPLYIVNSLDSDNMPKGFLGLNGDHQRENAALAIELAEMFLQITKCETPAMKGSGNGLTVLECRDIKSLSKNTAKGLKLCHWAGRNQIIDLGNSWNNGLCAGKVDKANLRFYLDGAHTPKSLQSCTKWFGQVLKQEGDNARKKVNILIFNCSRDRQIDVMLPELLNIDGEKWHRVIFCPADYARPTTAKLPTPQEILCKIDAKYGKSAITSKSPKHDYGHLQWQNVMKDVWSVLCEDHECEASVGESMTDTINSIKHIASGIKDTDFRVLVTGSLYLVGSALSYLGPQYL